MLRAVAACIPCLLMLASGRLAAETPTMPMTNFKTGISLKMAGQAGKDYAFERFYHDPKVDDRGVVYLRSTTQLRFEHNEQNIVLTRAAGASGRIIGANGEDGKPDSGDEGIIRMKVDMDDFIGLNWANGNISKESVPEESRFPRYSGPFSFAELKYFDGAKVLGAFGPSTDRTEENQKAKKYYWRGMTDTAGDEWHIITVGDDDESIPGQREKKYDCFSSDGRIYYFVVNPKTPVLGFAAGAKAQFYTTPAKNYFIPHLFDQTTYLTADVSLFFNNLTDSPEAVQYRIDDLQPSWRTYDKPFRAGDLGIKPDSIVTLRYRIGEKGPEKVRRLHFEPSYPSDREAHPSKVLSKDEQQWTTIRQNLETQPVHRAVFQRMRENVSDEQRGSPDNGIRTASGSNAVRSAFAIYIDGVGKHPRLEEMTRQDLLNNWLGIDPVGHELSHNLANPARERVYHGYYHAGVSLSVAVAYDLVIKTMRPDKTPHGFTAIEDVKIRDSLATFAVEIMQMRLEKPLVGFKSFRNLDTDIGMWSSARYLSLPLFAIILPTYDTPYYGTSGADGRAASHRFAPFEQKPMTWMAEADANVPIRGSLPKADPPVWQDRTPYFSLMNWLYAVHANTRMNFEGMRTPHVEQAYLLAAEGKLLPGKSFRNDSLTISVLSGLMMNENFPEIAAVTASRFAENDRVAAENAKAKAEGRPEQPLQRDALFNRSVDGVFGLCYCRPATPK